MTVFTAPIEAAPASDTNTLAHCVPVSLAGDILRLDEVLARFGNDGEFLLKSLDLFRSRSGGMMAELRRALDQQDYLLLERAAHSVKGSIGNFGAHPLFPRRALCRPPRSNCSAIVVIAIPVTGRLS